MWEYTANNTSQCLKNSKDIYLFYADENTVSLSNYQKKINNTLKAPAKWAANPWNLHSN